jgi:hypothetical protein
VKLGRRKSKRNNPRPQEEAKDNEYHKASQRNARYEEAASRFKSSTEVEAGQKGADGTPSGASNGDDRAVGGGEAKHGISPDRVCNNDLGGDHNASTRGTHGEGHTGPGKRKGNCRQLLRESALPRWLGTSHMSVLGPVGCRPILRKSPFLESET